MPTWACHRSILTQTPKVLSFREITMSRVRRTYRCLFLLSISASVSLREVSSLSESIALLLCLGLEGCSSEVSDAFIFLLVPHKLLETGAFVVSHVLLD